MKSVQGLKWQKARRLLLRLDKRGEDKVEVEKRRKEEEKRRHLRKEVEERGRAAFEQGFRKEIRAENLFQPRITQCRSQYQTKVKTYYLYPRHRFLLSKMDLNYSIRARG